jgi:hypothetical protein
MPSPDPSHPLLPNSSIPDIQSYQTAPHYKSEKGSLIDMLRYRPPHATQFPSLPLVLLFFSSKTHSPSPIIPGTALLPTRLAVLAIDPFAAGTFCLILIE